MSDTYYKQKFHSLETSEVKEIYIWSSDFEKGKNYPRDKKRRKMIPLLESISESPKVGKMTKEQVKKDRRGRATEHFKREIYPTFSKTSDEAKHFSKKYNLPKL